MGQKKVRLPIVICELLQWRLEGKQLSGEVFRTRDVRCAIDGEKRIFVIAYMVHYPKGPDEDEYYLARLLNDNYVKCFVSEKAEWQEALKALLGKPPGTA
jgi:hypothetical protein